MARSYSQDVLGAGLGGASELSELTDVSTSSPQAGQVLRYGGGSWANAPLNFTDVAMTAVALSFDSTTVWDVGAAPVAKLTLTGNTTITASNVPEGQVAVLVLQQDASGGRSVGWGAGFSGVDPVYALGPNGVSALYFGGTGSGLVMTQVLRASQAEAQAGTSHARLMTPLRTAQAIAAQAAPAVHQHTLAAITDAGALAGKSVVGAADLAGDALDGKPVDMQDEQLRRAELRDYAETATSPAISAGTLTLDLESGNAFDVLLTQNVSTVSVVNPPASGRLGSLTIRFRQDATGGRTVNLSGFDWGSAAAPVVPTTPNTGRLWLMALTLDGGASWDAMSGFGAS